MGTEGRDQAQHPQTVATAKAYIRVGVCGQEPASSVARRTGVWAMFRRLWRPESQPNRATCVVMRRTLQSAEFAVMLAGGRMLGRVVTAVG